MNGSFTAPETFCTPILNIVPTDICITLGSSPGYYQTWLPKPHWFGQRNTSHLGRGLYIFQRIEAKPVKHYFTICLCVCAWLLHTHSARDWSTFHDLVICGLHAIMDHILSLWICGHKVLENLSMHGMYTVLQTYLEEHFAISFQINQCNLHY